MRIDGSIALPASNPIALLAKAFAISRINIGVFPIVWMATRANSNEAFMRNAATNVFTWSDGLKVVRVNTASYATKMIDLHSGRDGSSVEFIGYPVSQQHFPFTPFLNLPVSLVTHRAHPNPASGFRYWHDIGGKPFNQRKLRSGHVTPFKSHHSGSWGALTFHDPLFNCTSQEHPKTQKEQHV